MKAAGIVRMTVGPLVGRLFRAGVLVAVIVGAACGRTERPAPPAAQPTTASSPTAVNASNTAVYMCPMDRDVRGYAPGKCPRCGMALVTSVPDPVEYRVDVTTDAVPTPGTPVQLHFSITDPWKGNPVTKFLEVHEKLYHAFVVSRDLQFFQHGHPQLKDGRFEYEVTFPRPGMYRVLSDFYPEASVPQLSASTMFVGRSEPAPRPVSLGRDYTSKQGDNIGVSMVSIPDAAVAGTPTRLRFALNPADGFEKYLGVWAHMLIASDDLIDMMHTHPSIADGGSEVEFTVVFPRARTYRLWLQMQRKGTVNTVHFDVPVKAMSEGGSRVRGFGGSTVRFRSQAPLGPGVGSKVHG
jgi:hypothetical protein